MMRQKIKFLKIISIVLFCNYSIAQGTADSLTLEIENNILFYQTEENKFDKYIENLVKITISNHSQSSYLIPIETTTFNIFDDSKEFEIELNGNLFGSPLTIYRPWIKVYDTLNNEVNKSFSFVRPDLESDEYKEDNKQQEKRLQLLLTEREEAYDKYGYMETEERIDMPEFYYFLKKHQYIIKPNQSIEFVIPVTLPENKVMLGTFRESFEMKDNENYKAIVEIDYSDNRLYKILTQEDIDSLSKAGVKVFNGVLQSNEVELVLIKD